ncbi:MAG: HD domain-containing protein [Clostridia bacterium]|nr:HD domain-containing protein [Clostridia bacterium]
MLTYEALREHPTVKTYIEAADRALEAIGYTEHTYAHVGTVAARAGELLTSLGYPARTVELARIAALLHDIGNVINRKKHSQSGALMAFRLLDTLGMDAAEVATVISAIGNHDEGEGEAVSEVAAALILADKSDVRRSRVRNPDPTSFDIHDRVNYSVISSHLTVKREEERVELSLAIDTAISPVMDYFEIFLDRMLMCKRAAARLSLSFGLLINDQRIM